MITLYTLMSISPNIRKALIMLEETSLPYTVKALEKHGDANATDEYRAISPNGTVPAIVDEENGTAVFESAAVLYYLAEKSGQFLPEDSGDRADVMKWLLFEAANVGPVMGELYHYMVYASDDMSDAVLQRYREKLMRYFSVLDRQLGESEYLAGTYSIADMILWPWLTVVEDVGEIELDGYPDLKRWYELVGEREAVRSSATAGGTGA
jgi:GST-like protein